MSCYNCEDGKVALTNNDGQVYEYRKCPLCTCKFCDGNGYTFWYGTEFKIGELKRLRRCEYCHPGRFDAHVKLWFKRIVCAPKFDDDMARSALDLPLASSPERFKQNVESMFGPVVIPPLKNNWASRLLGWLLCR